MLKKSFLLAAMLSVGFVVLATGFLGGCHENRHGAHRSGTSAVSSPSPYTVSQQIPNPSGQTGTQTARPGTGPSPPAVQPSTNPFGKQQSGGPPQDDPNPPGNADPDPSPTPPPDPYGNSPGSGGGPGYPGDDPDGTPSPSPPPAPQDPVKKDYEDGRFQIAVSARPANPAQLSTSRHFGYRIGQEIPISILVVAHAQSNVAFDFGAIKQGVLSPDGSDFELISSRFSNGEVDNMQVWKIDLKVRSFVPRQVILFNADFQYALGPAEDGKPLNWKKAATPDFVVSTSATADNGTDLLEGDMSAQSGHVSWAVWPLLLVGGTLALWWPVLSIYSWYKRIGKQPPLSDNERAWRVFHHVLTSAKATGLSLDHYTQIAVALRKYYGIEALTVEQSITALEHPVGNTPEEQEKQQERLKTLRSALTKLDDVLVRHQQLSAEQVAELIKQLHELVPKP